MFCSACTGVLDCEWCELSYDQLMNLEKPFCGTQRDCFGGIVGAQSPYNDQVRYPGDVSSLLQCNDTFLGALHIQYVDIESAGLVRKRMYKWLILTGQVLSSFHCSVSLSVYW